MKAWEPGADHLRFDAPVVHNDTLVEQAAAEYALELEPGRRKSALPQVPVKKL